FAFIGICVLLWAGISSAAADLKILPADVTLTGPAAKQQLLLVVESVDQATGDVTQQAKWASSNPVVASVNDRGQVRAIADGETTITAVHEGRQTQVKVKVLHSKEDAAPSF